MSGILIIKRPVSASGGHHQVKIRVSWRGRWVWVANGIERGRWRSNSCLVINLNYYKFVVLDVHAFLFRAVQLQATQEGDTIR